MSKQFGLRDAKPVRSSRRCEILPANATARPRTFASRCCSRPAILCRCGNVVLLFEREFEMRLSPQQRCVGRRSKIKANHSATRTSAPAVLKSQLGDDGAGKPLSEGEEPCHCSGAAKENDEGRPSDRPAWGCCCLWSQAAFRRSGGSARLPGWRKRASPFPKLCRPSMTPSSGRCGSRQPRAEGHPDRPIRAQALLL